MITNSNGLYVSANGGDNWSNNNAALKKFSGGISYRRHVLHPTLPNTIFWVSTYGILRSNDMGKSWSAYDLITPPGSANIYAFAINPQNENEIYYTATINTKSTFYKSMDGGNTWVTKKMPTGQSPTVLRVHPEQSSVLYMGFTVPPSKK